MACTRCIAWKKSTSWHRMISRVAPERLFGRHECLYDADRERIRGHEAILQSRGRRLPRFITFADVRFAFAVAFVSSLIGGFWFHSVAARLLG